MKPGPQVDPPPIALRPHPPERRLVRALARGEVAASSCSSCCCCCLHSVGSLAGAVVGSFYPRDAPDPGGKRPSAELRDDEVDAPCGDVPDRSAGRSTYWTATLGGSVLVSVCAMVQTRSSIVIALFATALLMPAIQLGASVLCVFIAVGTSKLRRDARTWKRLGWITLGTVVGGAVGALSMYLFAITR